MKKRILMFLTIMTAAVSVSLAFTAAFAENNENNEYDLTLFQEGDFPECVFSEEEYTPEREEINEALLRGDDRIVVSIPEFNEEKTAQLYESVVNTSPELYNVLGRINIEQLSEDEYTIYPQYKDEAELMSVSGAMNSAVNDILAQVSSDMSDVEKILAVHDYMLLHYEYDYTYSIYDAEDFFVNKKGVCQAYALAFKYIMDKLGITCTLVSSDAMNHAWNMVKVEGSWYHIDVTWDDPAWGNEYGSGDRYGYARHEYLLLSDEAISDDIHEHYDWYTNYTASSTKYDDYFWTGLNTPMHYYNGEWYFASDYGADGFGGGINKYSFETDDVINLISSYYIEGMGIYNGYVYILTEYDNIYTAPVSNIKDMAKLTEFTREDNLDGFYFENGCLYYALADKEYYMEKDDDFSTKLYDDYYKYRTSYSIDLSGYNRILPSWEYSDNTLKISFNGELPGYADIEAPWEEYKGDIKYIVFDEGITGIEKNAFYKYTALKCITFPSTLVSIESDAFYGCTRLNIIFLDKGIQTVADYAFGNCSSLAGVFYDGSEDEWNSIVFGEYNYRIEEAEIRYGYAEPEIFKMFDIDSGIVILEANEKALVGEAVDMTLKKYSSGTVSSYKADDCIIENTGIAALNGGVLTAVGKGRTKVNVTVGEETVSFCVYSGEPAQMSFENTDDNAVSGILIAASYFDDGALAEYVSWKVNDFGNNVTILIDYTDYGGISKGFIWESLDSMKLLSEAKIVE